MARIRRMRATIIGVPEASEIRTIRNKERSTSIQRWQSRWQMDIQAHTGDYHFDQQKPRRMKLLHHSSCLATGSTFIGLNTIPHLCAQDAKAKRRTRNTFHCPRFQNGRGEYEEPYVAYALIGPSLARGGKQSHRHTIRAA